MKIKGLIAKGFLCLFLVLSIFAIGLSNSAKVYAATEGSVLGASTFSQTDEIYIDGVKVEDPTKEIVVTTNKPSFFGYTLKNVTLDLLIQQPPVKGVTTSDSNGYWVYNLDKPLTPGIHTLYISMTDYTGASTKSKLRATFRVPGVLGVATTVNNNTGVNVRSLFDSINYFTIPLIIVIIITLLIIFYLFVKRRRFNEDK